MARKRATLKGKGASILLGEAGAEEVPVESSDMGEMSPEVGEGALPDASASAGEAVDWSTMLEDEVTAAGAPTEDTGLPSLPEIEHYYLDEELITPEPLDVGEPTVVQPSLAPPTPMTEVDSEEVDWSAMLEDEVSTAEHSPEEALTSEVPPMEYYYPEEEPVVPEEEMPVFGEPAVEEPSLEPVPALEPTTPPASPTAAEPPVAAATAPTGIRIGGLLAGVSVTDVEAPSVPGPRPEEVALRETTKAPPRELTEEEEEAVIGRVTRSQRRELFDRISQLYREVPQRLATDALKDERAEALLLLSEARDIVLEDPRQFDEAEHKVWQVEGIITQAENVAQWGRTYGRRLSIYLTIWFVVLMGAIMFYNPIASWLEGITAGTQEQALPIQLSSLAFTMMWGSLGGVLGGFYSLWKYVAEKQLFDKQYTIWYALQPISGLLIGALVHALVMTGFLSMFNQAGISVPQSSQGGFWFPAIIAVALGFRQNFALRLLDRMLEVMGQQPRREG